MKINLSLFMLFLVFSTVSFGQTAAFTYQGKLTDGVTPASGTYQMQFSLFNALSAGVQQGTTITNLTVPVVNGTFTVMLDFSPATPFSTGADRWLEIAVRKAADPPGFTTLAPRQQITSSPYSIRTLSASVADSAPFNGITSGTNAAALHVGPGGSLDATGGGTIAATSAPASGLTGTSLPASITGSSLTSVGTLSNLTVAGGITAGTGSVAIVNGTGKIPDISSTTFQSLNGSNLTGLNAANLSSNTVPTARLGSGTANSSSFLRGDSTWAAPSGGGVMYYNILTTPLLLTQTYFALATGSAGSSTVAPLNIQLAQTVVSGPMTIDSIKGDFVMTSTTGTADTITIELWKNGASTGMSITATNNTTQNVVVSASSTGGPVSFAAGDHINYTMTHTTNNPIVSCRMSAHAQ